MKSILIILPPTLPLNSRSAGTFGNPSSGRQRKTDPCEFRVSLVYAVSSRHNGILPQTNTIQPTKPLSKRSSTLNNQIRMRGK